MAYITSTPARLGFGHALMSPVRILVRGIEWIRDCNRMARDYVQMSHMTDSRLAKSGMTREDIPAAIRKTAGLF